MNLDYSLKTVEERVAWASDVLASTPAQYKTRKFLEYIADYILMVTEAGQTKEQKASEYPITTSNREVTINKRQVSYEQIVSSLENGEDGIYALINNDKNQLLDHKNKFTQEDIETIPGLKELMAQIETLKKSMETATGIRKYQIKKQIIETYQQIYILKASAKGAVGKSSNQVKSIARMDIPEEIYLNERDMPVVKSPVSLLVPEHVTFLLCYYHILKEETYEDLMGDMHWLLIDLENLIEKVFANYPVLYDLIVWKIDGLTNEVIQEKMFEKHGVSHNEQYYSTLWRKRIPKMIADQAKKDYLVWYFTNVEYGNWKYCNKCGQWKLAHPMFFSRNTSEDSFYSVCKDCRSLKNKEAKQQ